MGKIGESTISHGPAHLARVRAAGSIALDQWRGLALLLVLISHGFYYTNRVAGAGRIGVNLFFFISGILVFRSLVSSRSAGWKLAIEFWGRRLKRLYPALVAYLFLTLTLLSVLKRFSDPSLARTFTSVVHHVPGALTFTINYARGTPIMLLHLWSVSVEVQFYLVAPVVFLVGKRSRVSAYWVFGGLLCTAILYGFLRPLHTADFEAIKYHFGVAVWPMMLGFSCEFAKAKLHGFSSEVVRWIYNISILVLPLALFAMLALPNSKLLVVALGAILLVPCFMAYLYGKPFGGSAGAVLAWMGKRTYSVYLYQQPLSIAGLLPAPLHPFGALASLLVGAISFEWFEKPFLRRRQTQRVLLPGAVPETESIYPLPESFSSANT